MERRRSEKGESQQEKSRLFYTPFSVCVSLLYFSFIISLPSFYIFLHSVSILILCIMIIFFSLFNVAFVPYIFFDKFHIL